MFGLFKKNQRQLKEEIRSAISDVDETDRLGTWVREARAKTRARAREEALQMGPGERRRRILHRASETGANFVVWNRKNDSYLGRGHVEDAIESGEVSVDEILRAMSDSVRARLSDIPPPASGRRRG